MARFLTDDEVAGLAERTGAATGDLLLLVADARAAVNWCWAGCGPSWAGGWA